MEPMEQHQALMALGAPEDPTGWLHASAGRAADGVQVECWLQLGPSGQVKSLRFEMFASLSACHAAAWFADWSQGREAQSVLAMTGFWLAEMTGLPDESRHEALVIEDALRAAFALAQ